jgi:protein-tyrosine phosphatase
MTEVLTRAEELQKLGAWIQLNADAVLGMEGLSAKRYCRKMLQARYVDVIASDSHGISERACHLGKCRDVVSKKYGQEYAKRLFQDNPSKIIDRM